MRKKKGEWLRAVDLEKVAYVLGKGVGDEVDLDEAREEEEEEEEGEGEGERNGDEEEEAEEEKNLPPRKDEPSEITSQRKRKPKFSSDEGKQPHKVRRK